jgi:hypothetical protein
MMYHYGFWGFPGFWGFGWIAAVIAVIPFWKICGRVGLSPWLSVLVVVPLANLIFIYWLAFSQWPIQRGGSGFIPPAGPDTAGQGTGTPSG